MRLLAHVMPWFGDSNIHRMTSYVSNDPVVITNQINILMTVRTFGIQCQGVIMTWQGPNAAFQHSCVMEWNRQCVDRGLLFCLLMDPWLAKIGSPDGTANLQTTLNALNHADTQTMLNSACYVPELYLLDFNIAQNASTPFSIPNDVAPHFPTWTFLEQGSGFAWPAIPSIVKSEDRNAASVANLQSQHQNPAMKVPAVGLRFMDAGQPTPVGVTLANWTGSRDYNSSVWGGAARVLDTQGGKLFFDYFDTVPGSTPYLGLVTWNDYDEQTDVEAFYAMLAGIRIGS